MKPERLVRSNPIFRALSVCVAFVISGSLINRFDISLAAKPKLFAPDAFLSPVASIFPRINLLAALRQSERIAALHGPDWVLESTVTPSCLPEREVAFSTEAGQQSLHHSVT